MRKQVDIYYSFWKSMIAWVNMYLNGLEDEDLNSEIIPGGNHGVWILGHLIACEDDLSDFLGKGPILFPDYQDSFKQSGKLEPVSSYPPIQLLRKQWKLVCEKNDAIYLSLTDHELKDPHNKIEGEIDDDYFKTIEGCLKNWTLHQIHHAGQLAILRAKSGKQRLV